MADTLELLMAKAEQRKDDKVQSKKFKSHAIGGEIVLRKPPLKKITDIMDEADINDTYASIRSNAAIVYEAWPFAKDNFASLKDAYEASDPYDLVVKIFEDDIQELNELAQTVMEFYGLNVDEVKN